MLGSRPLYLALVVLVGSSQAAVSHQCPKHSDTSPAAQSIINQQGGTRWIYQEFGTEDEQTAWLVGHGEETSQNAGTLYVTEAYFRPGKNREFIKVLGKSGLWDIHVPYARGGNRYWDIRDYDEGLNHIDRRQTGPCTQLIGTPTYAAKEIRDRGLMWKQAARGRRGYEMVLWTTQNAHNYDYLISYRFSDIGTIRFEVGATSMNLPGSEYIEHLHTGLWRIDLDVGGADNDTVFVTNYDPKINSIDANLTVLPFNNGKEGFFDLDPTRFNTIIVKDRDLKNRPNPRDNTAFQIIPMMTGFARRHTNNTGEEAVLAHDVWVTNQVDVSIDAVPEEAADEEDIIDKDVVLWMATPILHVPRDEDGLCNSQIAADGDSCNGNQWDGVALVMSTGLTIVPRNLFAGTPFH